MALRLIRQAIRRAFIGDDGQPRVIYRAFANAKTHAALMDWVSAPIPPNVDIRAGLKQLRARSREAAQNDDHARHFLRLVEVNVVGAQGVAVRSRPELQSGTVDADLGGVITRAYERQSKHGVWDATGKLSRAAFGRLGVRTIAMDGEVLIRIREGEMFHVELVDSELLDVRYNQDLNGGWVEMGIEFDADGIIVAYHLLSQQRYSSTAYSTVRRRVPAGEILHVFLPEWVNQIRGVPWTATALGRMKMLSGYEVAAITAARGAAIKSGIYTKSLDPAGVISSPSGTVDGKDVVQELTPGQVEMAPAGWDLKPLDWSWPNTEHDEFVKACLRGIASGLGVSYNALTGDLENANYSSLRQGALSDRDVWTQLQSWWIDNVERPIYERWLAWAIVSGAISVSSPQRFSEIEAAAYQGRRWPWVDPLKDIQAAREAVALRTKSISDIIREQGRSPREVWEELANDMDALENEFGIGIANEQRASTGNDAD